MIYLIDDNQYNQQEIYGCDFIKEGIYSDFLTPIYKIKKYEFLSSLKETLTKADAIFIHNTFEDVDEKGNYIQGNLRVRDAIVHDIIDKNNIPYVIFSRGMGEFLENKKSSIYSIEAIDKKIFYENLKSFLDNYKENTKFELRILYYGLNYIEKEARNISNRIIAKIQKQEEKGIIYLNENIDFESEEIDILDDLENYHKIVKNETTFDSFLNNIEKYSYKDFIELIKKINFSILRHGRNIYTL